MNKNLNTQMAELRNILASIENKSLNEGPKAEIGKEFIGILAGKSAKQMASRIAKDFGKKFEVTVAQKSAIVGPGGDAITKQTKTVYEHVDGTTTYKVLEVNGKDVSQRGVTVEVSTVVEQIEKSIEQGQVVKSVEKQVVKPFNASAEAEATAKAEKLDISQLEQKIASKEGTALEQKAYAKALAEKKAAAPKTEVPPNKTDPIAVAKAKAPTMSREELEAAVSAKNFEKIPAAVRKEYELELAKRGPKPVAAEVPKAADDVTKAADDAPKTGADVLIKKENEKAITDAKQALDDGTVKVKEDDLLPKKPNETPAERVERTLKEDPRYADKYDSIQNTSGVAKLWNWIKEHPKSSLLVATLVALSGYGTYQRLTRDEAEQQNDDAVSGETPVVPGETEEEKKKRKDDVIAADEKKAGEGEEGEEGEEKLATLDGEKTNGEKTDGKADGGAAKVTGKENDGKATPEQNAELTRLKAQIDALIAELSKSKDPAILKRLEAVRARLGQSGQATKVTGTGTQGEWRDVGQDYERWYGPKGVDGDGQPVYNGMVRPIVYDAGQEDEFSKLNRPELLRRARLAAKQKQ